MKDKQPFIVVFILGSLSTISPFAIDMYLPGFPAIARELNTTIDVVQLSLTSYFIGIAAGQILYGPLLDRFGRKKPLYLGLTVYIITSLGCAFTNSAESLIVMRFFQALGGCVGIVAANALVRDLFPANRTAQAFSSMALVVAISPMIAPTIGGYMTKAWGWHSVFIVLAAITVVIQLAVYLRLPDGKKADPSISLKPSSVLGNFYIVMRQPQFIVYAIAGGCASAAPFAYIAGSADVFMNQYHATEKQYGWIFAIVAGAIIGATQLNHIFLRRSSSEKIILFAFVMQMAMGTLLVVGTLLGWYSMIALVAIISIFLSGHGAINPNATALSLAPFYKHTGSAASLTGSLRMAMGGIASALVSIFHNGTSMPMILVMVGCSVTGFTLLLCGRAIARFKTDTENKEEAHLTL